LKLNYLLDEDFLLALERLSPANLSVTRGRPPYSTLAKNDLSIAKKTSSPTQKHLTGSPESIFSSVLDAEGVCLYLDTTVTLSYQDRSKFNYARRLAATLGMLTLRQDKPLYVKTLSPTGSGYSPLLQKATQTEQLLQFLERLESGSTSDFLWSFYQNLVRRTPRASLIVILSDFLDPLWEESLNLLYQYAVPHSDVLLLQVLHPTEQDVLHGNRAGSSMPAMPTVSSESRTGSFCWWDAATQAGRPIVHESAIALPHLPPREVKAVQSFLHRLRAREEDKAEADASRITFFALTTDVPFEKYLLSTLQNDAP
jgi:hypothetical protein